MDLLFGAFVHVTASFRPRRRPDRAFVLPEGATVEDLMQAAGQPAVGTLAVRDGSPVPEDCLLREGDVVVLMSSFSGG